MLYVTTTFVSNVIGRFVSNVITRFVNNVITRFVSNAITRFVNYMYVINRPRELRHISTAGW